MTRLELLLAALVFAVMGADAVLLSLGGPRIDWPGYLTLALLCVALTAGGMFYRRVRPDARLAAMLFCAAFLTGFSAACAMLNYLLLPHAGAQIDLLLAGWDRGLGFHWPDMMAAMAVSPLISKLLLVAYSATLPQVAVLAILLSSQPARAYQFCLAIATGALICVGVWTFFPAFGAMAVYPLDGALAAQLQPQLGSAYARELQALLAHGPQVISPSDMKGLIGFPSYHAVMALLATAFAWHVRGVRWPFLVLNLAVLISTPLHGGHHLVDVLAGFPVAAAALLVCRLRDFPLQSGGTVNRSRLLILAFASKALFRAETAQAPLQSGSRD
jgi:hypothetical protein